jgi:hypothetical protein
MQSHEYTSAKGEDFLSWHDWAMSTLSEEELAIYNSEAGSIQKEALYVRWVTEEKITEHVVMEDGKAIKTMQYI